MGRVIGVQMASVISSFPVHRAPFSKYGTCLHDGETDLLEHYDSMLLSVVLPRRVR